MLFHLLVGGVAVFAGIRLVDFVRKTDLVINTWQWVLALLGFAYSIFVVEMIYAFALEGRPQASMVMGLIAGVVAVIWAVLMARFVFIIKAES